MIISTMTIMELSVALVGVLGACSGLIKVSNCKKIKCGITGLECEKTHNIESNIELTNDIKPDEFSKALSESKNTIKNTIKEGKK